MYEFGIELSIRDVQLIYKIKELLGVGTVLFRNRQRKTEEKTHSGNVSDNILSDVNMVIYRIRNKSHLKEIIIPIFDKYPFFTNKQYDYIRFRTLLLSNTIFSEELIDYTRPTLPLNNIESILNTFYFPA
jgi:LAGLIDADG endonuclease.